MVVIDASGERIAGLGSLGISALGKFMKQKTALVILLAFVVAWLTGCQSPEEAVQKAGKKVEREEQKANRN